MFLDAFLLLINHYWVGLAHEKGDENHNPYSLGLDPVVLWAAVVLP